MALFGFGKDKAPQDGFVQTMAYLEDALRLRSPFVLTAQGRRDTAASLHSVSEDGRTFRLLPEQDFKVEKGGKVAFTLIHEGLRLGGSTQAAETREGVVVLQFPERLALMERRKLPRARLNPKEGATLTAVQNLFEGVGITSTLDNISERGARVRVDRAINVLSEKKLVLGPHLVEPGQVFMVIKLNKVPKCHPLMETTARAVYLDFEGSALMMGLAFDKPSQEVEAALRRMVAGRAKPIPDALPAKTRRPKPPEPEEDEPLVRRPASTPVSSPIPAPVSGAMATPVSGSISTPVSGPISTPVSATLAAAMAALAPESTSGSLPGRELFEHPPDPELPLGLGPLPTEPSGAERRTHLRLSLGPGFRASFLAAGARVPDADLLDVSVGGCCLRLLPEACRELQTGVALADFHFMHRDLPNGVLPAAVTWILGKNAIDRPGPAEGRYCLVGVQFQNLPPEIEEGLEEYIAWHLPMD